MTCQHTIEWDRNHTYAHIEGCNCTELQQRIAELEEELKSSAIAMNEENDRHIEHIALLEEMLSTMKFTVASTVGGMDYDGQPTSELNYLQRLRILVEKEQQLAAARLAVEKREHCATCGKPFTEGNRIEVVSDEFTLHYVCWPECPPAEEGRETLALLKGE